SIVRFAYDAAQEHSWKVGDRPVEKSTAKSAGEVRAVDRMSGTIDVLRGPTKLGSTPDALLPGKPILALAQKDALARVADHVIARGIAGDGPYRAVRELLLRRLPR